MAQITSKELTAIEDMMNAEEVLASKYICQAQCTNDKTLKDLYGKLAQSHQQHVDELYANLK